MFGMDNWEQAESTMQKKTADLVIEKGGIRKGDLRYLFAGDLLGQLIATSFGTVDLEIPLFGLYGACSTMGEALGLGAMAVNAGYADQVMSMASSILPLRKNSSVFRWLMGTSGRPLPHGR